MDFKSIKYQIVVIILIFSMLLNGMLISKRTVPWKKPKINTDENIAFIQENVLNISEHVFIIGRDQDSIYSAWSFNSPDSVFCEFGQTITFEFCKY